jgi:serine phosphatase RsbU (regulator of sigma subunit)
MDRMDYDMELAREAQAQFLPRKLPALKTLSYAGICLPAGTVGGDFYDFLSLPYECFGLVVGDIAGKGVAAALQMANLGGWPNLSFFTLQLREQRHSTLPRPR